MVDGRKVLVFSERAETLSLVRDLLQVVLKRREEAARQIAERLVAGHGRGRRLNLSNSKPLSPVEERALLRMIAGTAHEDARWDDIVRLANIWFHRAAPRVQ